MTPAGLISKSLAPLGPVGGLAVGVSALGLAALGWNAVLLGQAAIAPASVVEPPEAQQKARLTNYEGQINRRVAQIDGRSMFLTPVAPRTPEPDEKKDDNTPPPKPTTYGGPGLLAIVYDRVWFDDGRSLEVGGEEEAGLAVVDVSPPWAARLRWRGVDFDVTLFSRTTTDFLSKPESETPPESPSPGK